MKLSGGHRGVTTAAATAQAQDADPVALYQEGNTLYDAQKYPEAEAKYQASWDARKSFDTAGNLGNVELQIGQNREAAEHLGYALKNFPPSGSAEKKAFLDKRYAEAVALIGTLDVSTNPDGASIWLDGKDMGKTPLSDALYVEPGGHTVEAKLAGYKDESRTLQAGQGERQKVFLGMTQAGDTTVPEGPVPKKPAWPYVAFGALTAAGLGVGVTFLVLAGKKDSDAEDAATAIRGRGGRCEPATPASLQDQCDDLDDLASKKATFQTASIGGWVGAGVGLVGLIAYAAWPGPKAATPPSAALSLRPTASIGPKGSALYLQGNF
jgi:tetratricopeptide (TPR) repeat protein